MPLTDAPEICGESWCYVNELTCESAIKSTLFPDEDHLYYSVEACAPEEEMEEEMEMETEEEMEEEMLT